LNSDTRFEIKRAILAGTLAFLNIGIIAGDLSCSSLRSCSCIVLIAFLIALFRVGRNSPCKRKSPNLVIISSVLEARIGEEGGIGIGRLL
jgi:hypothetical protein